MYKYAVLNDLQYVFSAFAYDVGTKSSATMSLPKAPNFSFVFVFIKNSNDFPSFGKFGSNHRENGNHSRN